MADDVNAALRAELEAAKSVLEPQIRGLRDLSAVSISIDLKQEVMRQIEVRERRMLQIQTVINFLDGAAEALDVLKRNGYPEVETSELSENLFAELAGENDDLDAAMNVFKRPSAENIAVSLGTPVSKPSQGNK